MELKISSPCPRSWDSLVGSPRVRYCGQCRLNVYNLAEMSAREIEEIVRKTEGKLCGRLFVRKDETATVRNCPRSARRRLTAVACSVFALLVMGALAWCFTITNVPDRSIYPGWVQSLIEEYLLSRRTGHLEERMGSVCPPPAPSPTAPSGGR